MFARTIVLAAVSAVVTGAPLSAHHSWNTVFSESRSAMTTVINTFGLGKGAPWSMWKRAGPGKTWGI
mgnify:CR=1 FL=1